MIGRNEEKRQLQQLLNEEEAQFVAVNGMTQILEFSWNQWGKEGILSLFPLKKEHEESENQ